MAVNTHPVGKLEMNSELNRPFRAQFFLTRIYRKRGHFIVIFQVFYFRPLRAEIIAIDL
jgi:hypothetical protein